MEHDNTELRADLAAYVKTEEPGGVDLVPLPQQADRSKLSATQQETLFSNWTSDILGRRPATWTPAERSAIRFAANRVLDELRG